MWLFFSVLSIDKYTSLNNLKKKSIKMLVINFKCYLGELKVPSWFDLSVDLLFAWNLVFVIEFAEVVFVCQ